MKPVVRHILTASAAVLVAALYIFVLTAERTRERHYGCKGLKVTITDSAAMSFVTEQDIAEYMQEYGPYVGLLSEEVDLRRIEEILSGKSAILGSEAWLDREGYIHIEVRQREPVIRFQKGQGGFYADEKGFVFPLQKNYTSRVPVIDGAVPLHVDSAFKGRPEDGDEQAWLDRIIGLTAYMQREGWAQRIAQITVLRSGDLLLVPAEGKERFLFGPPSEVAAKFGRIRTYYEAVVPALGQKSYSSVDVRFDKQIICK